MKEGVEITNMEQVMGEKMEIPNTDFYAVRRESYTELHNAEGEQIVVLPTQWSLFDIELWCAGYVVGVNAEEARGKKRGREEAKREIADVMGFTKELNALNSKIEGVMRMITDHIRMESENND